ncbi:hypothetical protein PRNP1_008348 [Phytophthora ramorum]
MGLSSPSTKRKRSGLLRWSIWLSTFGQPLAAKQNKAKHESCAAIASQIEEKDRELEALERHLRDQLQVVVLYCDSKKQELAVLFEVSVFVLVLRSTTRW